jgi:uncharacterized protein (TIGR03382 family)
MNYPYSGGGPLNMWGFQTFDGSTAQWDNVTINLSLQPNPAAPASTDTVQGGSISTSLGSGEIKWYKFHYNGAGPLTIDTLGSVLGPSNDTELGLYSVTGQLILQNDDIDVFGGNFLSSMTLDPASIPAGDYWVAAGGFNTDYLNAFGVSSTSTNAGPLQINGISIPEPGTLTAAALIAAAAMGRRRRAREQE